MLVHVDDLAGTHAVAAAIAKLARSGDVIVLAGEMGAGKTAFAQGFGRALGVMEVITSPTFTLVHSYATDRRLTLHHADLYRLERTSELADLAVHELADDRGVVLVEWGDVAGAALGDHLEVRLSHCDHDEGEQSGEQSADEPGADGGDEASDPDPQSTPHGCRSIEVHPAGSGWAGRWDRLTAELARWVPC